MKVVLRMARARAPGERIASGFAGKAHTEPGAVVDDPGSRGSFANGEA